MRRLARNMGAVSCGQHSTSTRRSTFSRNTCLPCVWSSWLARSISAPMWWKREMRKSMGGDEKYTGRLTLWLCFLSPHYASTNHSTTVHYQWYGIPPIASPRRPSRTHRSSLLLARHGIGCCVVAQAVPCSCISLLADSERGVILHLKGTLWLEIERRAQLIKCWVLSLMGYWRYKPRVIEIVLYLDFISIFVFCFGEGECCQDGRYC